MKKREKKAILEIRRKSTEAAKRATAICEKARRDTARKARKLAARRKSEADTQRHAFDRQLRKATESRRRAETDADHLHAEVTRAKSARRKAEKQAHLAKQARIHAEKDARRSKLRASKEKQLQELLEEYAEVRRQKGEELARISDDDAQRKRERRRSALHAKRAAQAKALRQARDEIDDLRRSLADTERRESYKSQFLPIARRSIDRRRRSSVNHVDRYISIFPELEFEDGARPSLDYLYCQINKRLAALER